MTRFDVIHEAMKQTGAPEEVVRATLDSFLPPDGTGKDYFLDCQTLKALVDMLRRQRRRFEFRRKAETCSGGAE